MNNCSFCTIRNAKGRVLSRRPEEILADVRRLAASGAREITLLSDECGSYGADIGTDLSGLLAKIAAADAKIRIKISTLYPGALLRLFPGLRPVFAAGRISYINIPLQSGSQRILGLMARRYDIKRVLKTVGEIRALSPKTWIYTHIIINFPTETHAEFLESLKASLYFNERMYIDYSDNRGTRASLLKPKVGRAEGRKRLRLAKAVLDKGRPGSLFPYDLDPEKNPLF